MRRVDWERGEKELSTTNKRFRKDEEELEYIKQLE